MPSQLPRITVRLDHKTYMKLIKLSEINDRAVSHEAKHLIKKQILAYERIHGEIKID